MAHIDPAAAYDFADRTLTQLTGRVGGPFTFRFALQPITATVLGVRAGLRHASSSDRREGYWRNVWMDVGRLCVLALAIDAVYQLLMFRWFYPGQALLIGVVLA